MFEEFPPGDPRHAEFDALAGQLPGASEPAMHEGRCLLLRRGAAPVARLCCAVTELGGAPVGIVGQYEAVDEAAGVALLREAQRRLTTAGAVRLLGPMDGSTWGRYRLTLPPEAGDPLPDAPPFLTEPHNPPGYAGHFRAAGFTVVARYESRIAPALPNPRLGAQPLAARIAAAGITVLPLDPARFDEEIHALFTFSAATFGSHPFFRTIDFAGFRALYDRLRPLLDTDLVLLARDRGGRLAGFVFAIPDALTAGDGRPHRLVLKTLAAHPAMRGLGAHLADEIHSRAHEKGYATVIHALMHSANASLRLSARYHSRLLRRYALYEWRPAR
jgi:GNAT superfamily N-acetyltransferase